MKSKVEPKTLDFFDESVDLQRSGIMLNLSSTVHGDWGLKSSVGSRRVSSKMTGRKTAKTENSPQRIHVPPQSKGQRSEMKRRSQTQKKWEHVEEMEKSDIKHSFQARYSPKKERQSISQTQGPLSGNRSIWKRKMQLPWENDGLKTEKSRIRSQPSRGASRPLKHEIMNRITHKISFIKRMTQNMEKKEVTVSSKDPSCKFQFERLYEHCLKKIKRGINSYERDYDKTRDKKYYELKIQSELLNKEFKNIRGNMEKKKLGEILGTTQNMGVVGNYIDLKTAEKCSKERAETQRPSTAYYKKKKSTVTSKKVEKNPFHGKEMEGWNVAHERNYKLQDFLL